MKINQTDTGIFVQDFGSMNLGLTLDCGQAFRWEKNEDDSFSGVAYGKKTTVKSVDGGLLFTDTSIEDVKNIWVNYFGLDRPYEETMARLCGDSFILDAYRHFGAIRILNQEPWETLCSFIISACNNIPRIKGIVKRLCEEYGEKQGSSYTFPSAQVLSQKTEEELAFLRAGYRVPYILDAAKRVASGEIDFDYIRTLSEDEARRELMKIKGVGRKVADCTLLFSLGFTDCYPVDRHIDRATKMFYPEGLPEIFSPDRGLAQQYIFSYMIYKNG